MRSRGVLRGRLRGRRSSRRRRTVRSVRLCRRRLLGWRRRGIRLSRRCRIRLRGRRRWFRMVNQRWRRIIGRRLWRRGILRGRRLGLARPRRAENGEPETCTKHQSAGPARETPTKPDTRRTFARNGTHSATPARRFCAEPRAFRSITTQLLLQGSLLAPSTRVNRRS